MKKLLLLITLMALTMQVSAMTINVRFVPTGESIALDVSYDESIKDVKDMIMEQEGIPVNVQRLFFTAKELEDVYTLDYYHVGENATLNLVINQAALKNCPLTFVAKEAGAAVSYTIQSGDLPPIEYSTDGSTWTTYTDAITLTNVGDQVYFRGNNETYKNSNNQYAKFSCTKDCYIYGNIMSLVNPTEYATATTLTGNYVFSRLFYSNKHIKNHPHMDLLLPATTLSPNCYVAMFFGCTGLTRVPALPATTLALYCYTSMFSGCSGLTSLPENLLPATTLARYCYNGMFNGCAGLTSIPENLLPATTLDQYCYSGMFQNCTGLTSIPENLLHSTTLIPDCYRAMFYGCSGLTSLPENLLPATTLANNCYYGMFQNCTGLTSLPENLLPATTLAQFCYQFMFQGCTGLTTIPENLLPATTLAQHCYQNMFYGCTGLTSLPENLLPATTLDQYCYQSMFQGCTGLTNAPVLPATTLPQYCYNGMFSGCSGLTVSPVLFAEYLNTNACADMFHGCTNLSKVTCFITGRVSNTVTQGWLSNVASNGTIYAPFNTVLADNGYIPDDWTLGVALKAKQDPQQTDVHYSTLYHGTQRYELPNDGTEAYVATLSGDALNLTKIAAGNQVLPENTAVILTSPSDIITLKPTDATAVTFSATNNLQGVDAAEAAPSNCYVLSGPNPSNPDVTEVGFYQFTGTLGAHKAYLVLPGGSGAPKRLRFVFDSTQDIEQPTSDSSLKGGEKILLDGILYIQRGERMYNAQGQMVR